MPRWKDGAPKQLYVLVDNSNGDVLSFERKEQRTNYVVKRTPTYPDGLYIFRTYIQKDM